MNQKPFQQAERDFFLLKGQLATNRLTRAQFDAALQKLNVRDEYGRAWRIEPENGAWQINQADAWTAADPKTYPDPPTAQHKTRSPNLLIFLALGAILFVCVCGIGAYTLLNATGVITTQVNFFPTATSTQSLVNATATPTLVALNSPTIPSATEPPLVTFEPTNPSKETPTALATNPAPSGTQTPEIPAAFIAFDADFFAADCPLFEGSNEIRDYTCTLGEYSMLHKQAPTTRYTYYDGAFDDAVVEANGYLIKGSGKYEYGIVFRANADGSQYYVFTVTNDGKYNVALYKDEKYTDLIPYTASPAVVTGTGRNFFGVVMRGNTFDFYLNKQHLNTVTDSTIARGSAGLFFYNAEPNTEVGFDQFTISTFTPPPPTATVDANATLAPTPSPNSVGFTDDFAGTCALFEGENETRTYKCENGEYTMLHKTDTGRWSVYDSEFADGTFEADGHFVAGSGSYEYGVVIRARDNPWTFYGFTVTGSGKYSVFLNKDSKYTDLIPYTESSAVKTGNAVNHFRVVAQGSALEFYLNEQLLKRITDATLRAGSFGFYLANQEPNVQAAFDNVRISESDQPQATPTIASAAPTVAVKPGVYVNSLRFTPRAPKRGEPVTFFATFVNSTGKPQNYKWLVEIFRQNETKPYGQADALQREIPLGTNERATGNSWKVAGGGPCEAFRAQVVFVDDQNRRVSFKRTNGADLWVNFQVCP